MRRFPPLPHLPNVLLGLLTLVCFGGPLTMLLVVRGGSSSEWPPDRAIEWIVAGLVCLAAAALFLACITIGWWYSWPGGNPRVPTSKFHAETQNRPDLRGETWNHVP
jgi:uncharacterized membrane protein YedE/YeeE